ncbi:MAG: ankyrin repeat domain-containing protein [Pseudomonadales bacterium]|jgi:ankyrin repeat protein|nr:ankyrin repeat domain-containing protein [Pseudomonadales bacterium]
MKLSIVQQTWRSAVLSALLAGSVHAQSGNEQQLLQFASQGNTAAARELLTQSVDVNAAQSDGTTALHWAVYYDDADLVAQLLRQGADVGVRNHYGATPLAQAAINGNAGIITALLRAGAEVDERGADDQTALMIVARGGDVAAATALLAAGADPNAVEKWRGQSALMWASAQAHPPLLQLLLAAGANPNAQSLPNDWERQVTAEPRMKLLPPGGMSALHYAAREGCAECARVLLAGGAKIDQADPEGVTPLVLANLNAQWDTAKVLIDAGANVDKWDIYGRSPLYAAVDYNTVPHGGRADRLSKDLTTSLDIIALILDTGGNPNLQLKLFPPYRSLGADRGADGLLRTGTTALLRAARGGDVEATALLLAHGARVDLPNEDGITPLLAASGYRASNVDTRGKFRTEEQAHAIATLLLDAGADANASESAGQTALYGAATNGWDTVVQLLAERGADLEHKDQAGRTPLDAALGRAGRFGRGDGAEQRVATAALLEKLLAEKHAAQ